MDDYTIFVLASRGWLWTIIGGHESRLGNSGPRAIITDIDPFTGKREKRFILMSVSTPNKGETVFRFGLNGPEGIAIDLGKLLKE